jgi:PilZ domain
MEPARRSEIGGIMYSHPDQLWSDPLEQLQQSEEPNPCECPSDTPQVDETNLLVERLAWLSRRQHSEPSQSEQRRHHRFPTDDLAMMRLMSPADLEPVEVRIVDASRDGFKLALKSPLDPGSIVQVRMRSALAVGEVRYCRTLGSEFHAGVQVRDILPTPQAQSEIT